MKSKQIDPAEFLEELVRRAANPPTSKCDTQTAVRRFLATCNHDMAHDHCPECGTHVSADQSITPQCACGATAPTCAHCNRHPGPGTWECASCQGYTDEEQL